MPATAPTGADVTTNIPYRPMGPWMDGCVPDSIRYVPDFRGIAAVPKVSDVVAPAATSVANDCTRLPCVGGVNGNGAGATVDHVAFVSVPCTGLVVHVAPVAAVPPQVAVTVSRPPPNCPTMVSEVGTVFATVAPVGVIERLFVRLMVRICPAGTVITTGDQVEGTPTTVDTDAGFNAAQVAAGARLVVAGVPQK